MTRMRRSLAVCALLLLPLKAVVVVASQQKKTWTLYHAWKGHDFSKRGSISLTLDENSVPTLSVENDIATTNHEDYLPMEDLYQLKLVENDDHKEELFTLVSVPACQVHRANFLDEIILTLNNRGSIVSMAYIPLVSPLAPSCHQVKELWKNNKKEQQQEAIVFSTKVTLETTRVGMSVPTILPATKPPQGIKLLKKRANNKEPGVETTTAFPQDEPTISGPAGWLRKYWYIILAIFFMSLSGGAQEQGATHGQGAHGQASAGTATSASSPIAASTPSPGGAKQRRGKRT